MIVKGGSVYIMSNFKRTVLYIGVTSDLLGRVWEHKEGVFANSFSKRYRTFDLVYYEDYEYIQDAIDREKQLKRYSRLRKDNLIQVMNPQMKDLYETDILSREG